MIKYINVRPALMRLIPWPWLPDIKQAGEPASLALPDLRGYYDWHTFMLEDCIKGGGTYGSRNHKSIFATARRCLGLSSLLDSLPDLSPITDRYMEWNQALVDNSPLPIDRFIIGDEVAGKEGPLIPRSLFKTWVLPHYRRLVDFAYDADAVPYFFLTGDVSELLPELASLGPNGLFFEPVGGMGKLMGQPSYDGMLLLPIHK